MRNQQVSELAQEAGQSWYHVGSNVMWEGATGVWKSTTELRRGESWFVAVVARSEVAASQMEMGGVSTGDTGDVAG